MRRLIGCLVVATVPMIPVHAEEFDYELSVGYSRSETDTTSVSTPVIGSAVSNTIGSETNELTLTGTWFFDGLSDDDGPRTRASFVDRASSLSLRYADASSETDALGTVIFRCCAVGQSYR
ncbi:MAG: hypothetical protein AAF004_15465 [Pseudomonadota bacterium]